MKSNQVQGINSALIANRKNCCVCEIGEIETHRTFKDFPVYMGTTKRQIKSDLRSDQVWGKCTNCGCLQLMQLLPLDVLYTADHASGSVGEIWKRHHQDFATFICRDNPNKILEIGAAHGILAHNILKITPRLEYTIIEPSPTTIPENARLIKDYIENQYELIIEADVIVHSHLIEHLYEPMKFIRSISENSKENALMYISFPNIEQLIKTGGTNSLNFEHTYYLHPAQLKSILEQNAFTVEEFVQFENHSFFLKCRKNNEVQRSSKIPNITHLIREFDEMYDHLQALVNRCNSMKYKKNENIYIFGAHVFSQTLIELGLNIENIRGIIDNSTSKQGERLYGTKLNVYSPSVLAEERNGTVILKASHYQEEIKNQLMAINPDVRIIE